MQIDTLLSMMVTEAPPPHKPLLHGVPYPPLEVIATYDITALLSVILGILRTGPRSSTGHPNTLLDKAVWRMNVDLSQDSNAHLPSLFPSPAPHHTQHLVKSSPTTLALCSASLHS